MGKARIIFRIYPKEGMLDKALKEIKELKPMDIQEDEVAFGIKLINVLFVYDADKNGSSEIEEKLKKLDSVSEVEVQDESLM
ncbi:MAG: hypothetical protein QXD11_01155 [Candidatus Micrarchaeaceae archaeon]